MSDLATLYLAVNSKEVKTGRTELKKLGTQASDTAKEVDKVTTSTTGMAKKTSSTFTSMSSGMKTVGRDLSRYITLPFLAASTAALKFSNDLTTGLGQVQTLIAGSGDRIYELQNLVENMSTATGASFSDLNRGLYETISAFQDGADTAGRFEAAVKASVAGNATVTDSVKLISAVTKAYGDVSEEAADKVADLSFAAVKYGQTTFSELSSAITKVTANSDRLGVSQEELFSIYATLTGVTGDAAEVTTQFNRILLSLANPTAELKELFSQYSDAQGNVVKTGEQFVAATGGAVGALKAIRAAAEESGETLQEYITRATGVTAAVALTDKQFDTFIDKFKLVSNYSGQMNEAFEAATTGINKMQVDLQKATATLRVAAAEIAQQMLPTIVELVENVANLADMFANADPDIQQWVVRITAATAAIGPLLIALGSLLRIYKLFEGLQAVGGIAGMLGLSSLAPLLPVLAGVAVALGVIGAKLQENKEYAENFAKTAESSKTLFEAYDNLNKAISEGTVNESQRQIIVSQLTQQYPALAKTVDIYRDSLEDVYTAVEELNKQDFLTNASKDIASAKKATRDYYVELQNAESAGQDFAQALFSGMSDSEASNMASQAIWQLTNDVMSGLSATEIMDRIDEVFDLDPTQLPANIDILKGSLISSLNSVTKTYEDYLRENEQLQDKAMQSGFTSAYITAPDNGDIKDWEAYIVNLERYFAEVVETNWGLDEKDLDPFVPPTGTDKSTRLKTWETYFSEIAGVAGEAFARIEIIDGEAVGYIQGDGKLAADAYANAFSQSLTNNKVIAKAIGQSFSIEDERDTIQSQIEDTMGVISDLLDIPASGIRGGVDGVFKLQDALGELSTKELEDLYDEFDLTDRSIQGLIDHVNELQFQDAFLGFEQITSDLQKNLEGLGPGASGLDQIEVYKESLSSLQDLQEGIISRAQISGGIISPEDIVLLDKAADAIEEYKTKIDETSKMYDVVISQLNSLPSLADIVAEALYNAMVSATDGTFEWNAEMINTEELIDAVIVSAGSALSTIAYSWGEAAAGVGDYNDALGELAYSIGETISQLAIQAGLAMIAFNPSNWAIGLALVAAGLAGQFALGYVDGTIEANATGGVYDSSGKVNAYAKGGVLSDYANSVVNKPTYFASGGTMNVMGEAGAEAIIPLTRSSSGDLGVNASGISGGGAYVQVNVINNTNEEVTTEETTDSSGNSVTNITIGKMMSSAITNGEVDSAMKSRYGTSVTGL